MHLAGYEVVKVVEQQHLEVVEEEGTLKSMTMTSSPSLYVPGMGNVSIGNVCFQVSAAEDDEEACKVSTCQCMHLQGHNTYDWRTWKNSMLDKGFACFANTNSFSAARMVIQRKVTMQVCTKLRCSAEQFKWLWAIRSIVEKIMLRECRTVAERFVEYCKRVVKEGADQMVSPSLMHPRLLNTEWILIPTEQH